MPSLEDIAAFVALVIALACLAVYVATCGHTQGK